MIDPTRSAVLVSVHVPKCAGTSVRLYLKKALGAAHRDLYADRASLVYAEDYLATEVLADLTVRSLSSHFIRCFPPALAGRRLLYVTFLRDPIEHFLSYYSYIRKVYAHITDPELSACLPPACDQLSSRAFTAWLLDRRFDTPFRENYATNFFARYTWTAATGRGPRPGTTLWPHVWDPSDWAAYAVDRLAVARRVLSRFFFVGLAEQLQAGLDVLRRRSAAWGFDLPAEPIGFANVSRECRDDTSWLRAGDPVGRRLLASLREDFALYHFAGQLFQQAVAHTDAGVRRDRAEATGCGPGSSPFNRLSVHQLAG
jgi:hypothetical protein